MSGYAGKINDRLLDAWSGTEVATIGHPLVCPEAGRGSAWLACLTRCREGSSPSRVALSDT